MGVEKDIGKIIKYNFGKVYQKNFKADKYELLGQKMKSFQKVKCWNVNKSLRLSDL
jgi:hypothetical protein